MHDRRQIIFVIAHNIGVFFLCFFVPQSTHAFFMIRRTITPPHRAQRANGALATLALKGLEGAISHSIVHPTWQETRPDDDQDAHRGWVYRAPGDAPLANPLGHGSFACDDRLVPDACTGAKSIRELYNLCGDEVGPFTTPVLYDKKTKTIVSNESTEILKMLNDEFDDFAEKPDFDMYPADVQDDLQRWSDDLVYPKVNNGVYRCGFAKGQEAYDVAVKELFSRAWRRSTKSSASSASWEARSSRG